MFKFYFHFFYCCCFLLGLGPIYFTVHCRPKTRPNSVHWRPQEQLPKQPNKDGPKQNKAQTVSADPSGLTHGFLPPLLSHPCRSLQAKSFPRARLRPAVPTCADVHGFPSQSPCSHPDLHSSMPSSPTSPATSLTPCLCPAAYTAFCTSMSRLQAQTMPMPSMQ